MQIYQLQQPNNRAERPTWVVDGWTPGALNPHGHCMSGYSGALVADVSDVVERARVCETRVRFGQWDWSPNWFLPLCRLESVEDVMVLLDLGLVLEFRTGYTNLHLVRGTKIVKTYQDPTTLQNHVFWDHMGVPV